MTPSASCFPLGEGVTWAYAAIDPVLCLLTTVRVRPPIEIDVEDVLDGRKARERAWVLEQSDRDEPRYAVARDGGVEIVERRTVGQPAHRALVVSEELRWEGPSEWSLRGGLRTRRYRREGEEDVTVTAGRFRCQRILLDDGETGTVWIAPGVGLVRSVGAVEGLAPTRYLVLELHSYVVP